MLLHLFEINENHKLGYLFAYSCIIFLGFFFQACPQSEPEALYSHVRKKSQKNTKSDPDFDPDYDLNP